MRSTCVKDAIVVRPGDGESIQTVVFSEAITSILPADAKAPEGAQVIDGRGLLLTPGLVDLHTHGIHRYLYETNEDELLAGLKIPAQFGTTTVLPTLYRELQPKSLQHLERLAKALSQVSGCHAPGFHLEGPFLALGGAGGLTMKPDLAFLDELLAACDGKAIAMSTSAELPGVIPVIERLVEKNVAVFLTHTRASYEQTQAAIDAGASHATHFYCVFPMPIETEPGARPVGAIEAFLGEPRTTVDFICDGVHTHPGAIRAAMAAKGTAGIVAITDSNIGAGLPEGVYDTGWGYPVHVSPTNAARNADPRHPNFGTLAGSSLTMNLAVKNLRQWLNVPSHAPWAMASTNPARVVGLNDRGVMRTGAVADLVLWDKELNAQKTWVNGKLVFSSEVGKQVEEPLAGARS